MKKIMICSYCGKPNIKILSSGMCFCNNCKKERFPIGKYQENAIERFISNLMYPDTTNKTRTKF